MTPIPGQPGTIAHQAPLLHIAPHPHDLLRPSRHPRRHRGQLAAVAERIPRRLGRRVVRRERRDPRVVGIDAVEEVLAPCLGRRHLHQILDVDRRQRGPLREVALAVGRLHPDAAAILEHEPDHDLSAQHLPAALLDHLHQRSRQLARAPARDRPTPALASEHDRVGKRAGARRVDRLPRLERHPKHERLNVAA